MKTLGYARPLALAEDINQQLEALSQAACDEIVVDRGKGRHPRDLKRRAALLARLGAGDTLVVYRLEVLAISGKDLLETLSFLTETGIDLRLLKDNWHSGNALSKETLLMITVAYSALSGDKEDLAAGPVSVGRTAILRAEDLPAIQADMTTSSVSDVARKYRVSRSTLYNFLKRMERTGLNADCCR